MRSAIGLSRSGEQLAQKLYLAGVKDVSVLNAIAQTPRELFVEQAFTHKAYDNTALPIGKGQTISQPYIVAKMTELLKQLGRPQKVLEIGTGSGYQTAILAQIFGHVYTVERIKSLQYQAKRRLQQLDLHNVSMKHGDGWQGWASKGPFDAIIVTAAARSLPPGLVEQLSDGGSLIIPVGTDEQWLNRYYREGDRLREEKVEAVRFVPLVAGELE